MAISRFGSFEGRFAVANYGLKFSFSIDDGELDGLSPQECFALGYELSLVRDVYAKQKQGGAWPVHAKNSDRIRRALDDAGRKYELNWSAGDSSESWMQLVIKPK